MRLLASINWNRFEAKAFEVTLTYPRRWPEDPETWKKNLDTFNKRLKRQYPGFSAIWRMEFQGREAPHFHLLLFVPRPCREPIKDLRAFVARAWYEACGKLCSKQLRSGTRVKPIYSTKKLNQYARYIAKTEQLRVGVPNPGRLWAVWGRERIPIDWEEVKIGVKEAYKIRRIYRRLARLKGRGPLRSIQVFVRYENVIRLLSWMGCYRG